MGEAGRDALRLGFEGTIKLEFRSANVSSDTSLFSCRDIDEGARLGLLARSCTTTRCWDFNLQRSCYLGPHNGSAMDPREGQMGNVEQDTLSVGNESGQAPKV